MLVDDLYCKMCSNKVNTNSGKCLGCNKFPMECVC